MAKKVTTSTISYKISLDQLENLINKIKDLTKLDNTVILNFSNTELFLYSVIGKNIDNVHAFKSHTINIKDLFTVVKDKLEKELKYILSDAKKFTTSISVFIKYMRTQNIEEDLEFKLYFNEEFCERFMIKNSKSKEETSGGKPNNHTHRLGVDDVYDVMNIDNAYYSFDLSKDDFDYIKAKTSIEKENDILYLNINDNKLSLGENRWDHNICNVEFEDTTISFPKKYFKCINYDKENNMKIYVTDTFLLILGDNTNLLISIELSV